MSTELVTYETDGGKVQLSQAIVKQYICGNSAVSDREVFMFMKLCEAQKLNPFLREAYLVKYGSSPATIIVGKEAFTKKAFRNSRYEGHEVTSDGQVPDLTATAKVYVNGYKVPITVTVDYDEYAAKNSSGQPNAMWASKPKTMLKKVALVQALREAFPEDLGGLYSEEEINTVNQGALPRENIVMENITPKADRKFELAELMDKKVFDMNGFKSVYGEIENMTGEQVEEAISRLLKKADKEAE